MAKRIVENTDYTNSNSLHLILEPDTDFTLCLLCQSFGGHLVEEPNGESYRKERRVVS